MATPMPQARTQGDDEAVTLIEFATGAIGIVESSWNRPGGMDDCIEVFGDKGQTYADLLMGNALPTYSEVGFGYAVEKRSEEHTSELQSLRHLVCRLLLEKKKKRIICNNTSKIRA